mgnify:CR=1 FL=1
MPQTVLTMQDEEGRPMYEDVLNSDDEPTGIKKPVTAPHAEEPTIATQTVLNPWSDGEKPNDIRSEIERADAATKEAKDKAEAVAKLQASFAKEHDPAEAASKPKAKAKAKA